MSKVRVREEVVVSRCWSVVGNGRNGRSDGAVGREYFWYDLPLIFFCSVFFKKDGGSYVWKSFVPK